MAIDLINQKRVNPEVIEVLEELLKRAKTGYTISIAVALVNCDGTSGNTFTDQYPVCMLGSLRILERELTDACIDTRLHKAGVVM